MKFVFFGTPRFAVFVLEELEKAGFLPALVVTAPDKPTGRKQILTPSSVKVWAEAKNIPILQPENLKDFENWKLKIENCDLGIVAAYSKLIPLRLLDLPKHGMLNVHPSLLPKYRGPTPIQTTILNGEKETGVTIMKMDEEIDHGPIVINSKFQIPNSKFKYLELEEKLAREGGKMLAGVMPKWITGEIEAKEQDHDQATFTKKFTSEDAFIKPETILGSAPAEDVAYAERQVRALNPEPGAWTLLKLPTSSFELQVKILSAEIRDSKLVPIRVIPAGKKEMLWQEFRLSHHF